MQEAPIEACAGAGQQRAAVLVRGSSRSACQRAVDRRPSLLQTSSLCAGSLSGVNDFVSELTRNRSRLEWTGPAEPPKETKPRKTPPIR